MNQEVQSYEEIVSRIKFNLEHYTKEADKFRRLYHLAIEGNTVRPLVEDAAYKPLVLQSKMNSLKSTKKTFESVVLEILNNKGRPMYAGEFLASYNEQTGSTLSRKNFSSKLAMVLKAKKTIRNKEYKELPNRYRFWWGLSDWYDDNDFKSDFKERIMIQATKLVA